MVFFYDNTFYDRILQIHCQVVQLIKVDKKIMFYLNKKPGMITDLYIDKFKFKVSSQPTKF